MNDYAAGAEVLCLILTAIGALLAYLWRRAEGARDETIKDHGRAIKNVEDAFAAYKLHVAEHYVTTNELTKAIDSLNETIKAVFGRFDRLESKIDAKADK